jgi:hypothetical protein
MIPRMPGPPPPGWEDLFRAVTTGALGCGRGGGSGGVLTEVEEDVDKAGAAGDGAHEDPHPEE